MRKCLNLIAVLIFVISCNPKKNDSVVDPTQENDNGLSIDFIIDEPGDVGQLGDIIEFDLIQWSGDKQLANTFLINGYCARVILSEPQFEGDYMEGLSLVSVGDSVVFTVAVEDVPELQVEGQPNDTMRFVCKIRAIWNEKELIKDLVAKLGGKESWKSTTKGIQIKWDERGNGKLAQFNDSVKIHIKGLFTSGIPFMNTHSDKPVGLRLGYNTLGPRAIDDAILQMREGDKVTVISPHDMAYGAVDKKPILKYSTIVFEIDLISIENQ